MMNKKATREKMQGRHINLSAWCRSHSLPYPQAHALLTRDCKILETRTQIKIIDALIADDLFVGNEQEAA